MSRKAGHCSSRDHEHSHLGLTHILLRLLSFPLGSRGTGLADLLRMPAME